MIARIWHGKTKASDATAYLEYLFKSGIPAYRATRGNKGAWVLRRMENDGAHFITLSFWESREAIAALRVSTLRLPNTTRRTKSTCSNLNPPSRTTNYSSEPQCVGGWVRSPCRVMTVIAG